MNPLRSRSLVFLEAFRQRSRGLLVAGGAAGIMEPVGVRLLELLVLGQCVHGEHAQ